MASINPAKITTKMLLFTTSFRNRVSLKLSGKTGNESCDVC